MFTQIKCEYIFEIICTIIHLHTDILNLQKFNKTLKNVQLKVG